MYIVVVLFLREHDDTNITVDTPPTIDTTTRYSDKSSQIPLCGQSDHVGICGNVF
ncbi:MAG: hypothetical protein ABJZ62_10560 [Hyphomicrobiales bacterium]